MTWISTRDVEFPPQTGEVKYTNDFKSIIQELLKRNPTERIGREDGVREIVEHPWFADIDIDEIFEGTLKNPICSSHPELFYRGNLSRFKATDSKLNESILTTEQRDLIQSQEFLFKQFAEIS